MAEAAAATIPSPYAKRHENLAGPGDARPTAFEILKDNNVIGKLTDKTFLVTGGTDGLGLETVRQLAKTGARVFFTARNEDKAKKTVEELHDAAKTDKNLEGARIEWVKIDNSSLKSVKEGAEDFLRRSDKLNVLVCNAGESWLLDIYSSAHQLTLFKVSPTLSMHVPQTATKSSLE